MTLKIFMIPSLLMLILTSQHRTASCQQSSKDTICIDKGKYTAIVNGLIRMELKDSLLEICSQKNVCLDSIVSEKDKIISGNEIKSTIFVDQIATQEQTINLHLGEITKLKMAKNVYRLGLCVSGAALLTILLLR